MLAKRAQSTLRAAAQVARWGWLVLIALAACCWPLPTARAEVTQPVVAAQEAITIEAARGSRWQEGEYEVWLLDGNCSVQQGSLVGRSPAAVVWILRGEPTEQWLPANALDDPFGATAQPNSRLSGSLSKAVVYLEGGVEVRSDEAHSPQLLRDHTWLGRLQSIRDIRVNVARAEPPPAEMPSLVERGATAWRANQDRALQLAQFVPETVPAFNLPPLAPLARHLQLLSRGNSSPQLKSFPGRTADETAVAITGGVRAVVSGIQNVRGVESGTVTLEADRIVVWTNSLTGLAVGGGTSNAVDGRWEFYLEGNIIYREGNRVIYADRMYYNVTENYGTILNAEMLTPIPQYEGLLRLKADVLQQVNEQNFLAYGAALTSSRLGVPRYWFQTQELSLVDVQQPLVDPVSGQPLVDPLTGEAAVDHQMLATSRNNFLYVAGAPVLYWPTIATDLTEPTFYVDRFSLRNDSVFGTQVLIDWNLYQLLGIRQPLDGTKWSLSTDYLSERGPALGTNFRYNTDHALWFPGPTQGSFDIWGIKDSGLDNLGADRRALALEEDFRGRALWQHRQQLASGYQFTGELGLISDRNFLEQYYEQEWDQQKDQTTGLELKRYMDNSTWSVTGDVRLNDFFTQTEWLPRFDHFLLGQSLLWDRLTWNAHSHVGYARLRTATPPADPVEFMRVTPLPWEVESEGLHVSTRQEIDMPIDLGPAKIVPYALGELFQVQEDLAGQQLTRAYGQLGIRSSLPMWRADPNIRSELWNLNGLAHKVSFDSEFFWADANRDIDQYPLYEPLDDDAIEFFRRRFLSDTFAGFPAVPLQFDERYFALRSGMQSWVTAPSTEIADDLMKFTLALRQRWQTKRGLPGQERIVDWIVFDVEASLFPDPNRDNFGQEIGLANYDFRWHVGDRVTILSDGFADFFGDGLRTFSLGGVLTRPERGSLYLGVRTIEGPISSTILSGSVGYRMSEKWLLTGGAAVDFGQAGNIGQTVSLTRIGESTLLKIGFNVDASRDNVGVNFSIEPRFLSSSRLGWVGGVQIPPAGAYGLE